MLGIHSLQPGGQDRYIVIHFACCTQGQVQGAPCNHAEAERAVRYAVPLSPGETPEADRYGTRGIRPRMCPSNSSCLHGVISSLELAGGGSGIKSRQLLRSYDDPDCTRRLRWRDHCARPERQLSELLHA